MAPKSRLHPTAAEINFLKSQLKIQKRWFGETPEHKRTSGNTPLDRRFKIFPDVPWPTTPEQRGIIFERAFNRITKIRPGHFAKAMNDPLSYNLNEVIHHTSKSQLPYLNEKLARLARECGSLREFVTRIRGFLVENPSVLSEGERSQVFETLLRNAQSITD